MVAETWLKQSYPGLGSDFRSGCHLCNLGFENVWSISVHSFWGGPSENTSPSRNESGRYRAHCLEARWQDPLLCHNNTQYHRQAQQRCGRAKRVREERTLSTILIKKSNFCLQGLFQKYVGWIPWCCQEERQVLSHSCRDLQKCLLGVLSPLMFSRTSCWSLDFQLCVFGFPSVHLASHKDRRRLFIAEP